MQISAKLILASQSPRRRALLDQLDMSYTVRVSPADERVEKGLAAEDVVRRLAHRKATPVAAEHPTALTLAADTVVAYDGEILNKPRDEDHAAEMLRRLSGTTHRVYTGIALLHPASDREAIGYETTHVRLADLTDDEIDRYVATGSPMDKAGGYGIQDHTAPVFIEGIDGDYYNVVGLPLRRFYRLLRASFDDLLLF
jgi:septum formation protein